MNIAARTLTFGFAVATAASPGLGEVVDSGEVEITVVRDFTGITLNLVTGEVTRQTNNQAADLFIFELSGEWRFANLDTVAGGGIVADTELGPASLLERGDFVGPGQPLQSGGGVRSEFRFDDVENAYLGLLFENEGTGALHYGWVEMTLPSAGNGVITRYAYNSAPGEGLVILPSADLDGDGVVNASDLAALIAAWGTADADLTGDGVTDASDLAALITAWG